MPTPLDVRWFVIDRAVMAYKETETDVLYGVAVDRARWWRIRGLKLTYYMAWQLTAQWWRIKGLKLTYYMAWNNLVPRACDPREGTRGSGIIRCRKPGILAKIELRIPLQRPIRFLPETDYPRASRSFPRIAGSGNEIGRGNEKFNWLKKSLIILG